MFMCVFSLYWMIWNLHQTLFKLHCVDIKKNILARQQAISVKKITSQSISTLANFIIPYIWEAQVALQNRLPLILCNKSRLHIQRPAEDGAQFSYRDWLTFFSANPPSSFHFLVAVCRPVTMGGSLRRNPGIGRCSSVATFSVARQRTSTGFLDPTSTLLSVIFLKFDFVSSLFGRQRPSRQLGFLSRVVALNKEEFISSVLRPPFAEAKKLRGLNIWGHRALGDSFICGLSSALIDSNTSSIVLRGAGPFLFNIFLNQLLDGQ